MRGEVVRFSRNKRKGSIILQEEQISKAQLPQFPSHHIQQTPGLNEPITISPPPSTTSTNQTADKKVVCNRDQCCHSTSSSTPSAIITSSNPPHHVAQSSTAKFFHSLHLLLPILPLNNLHIPSPLLNSSSINLFPSCTHSKSCCSFTYDTPPSNMMNTIVESTCQKTCSIVEVAEKDDAADEEEEEEEEVRFKVSAETPRAAMRLGIFAFGRAAGLL
jgi:hypothetical protein